MLGARASSCNASSCSQLHDWWSWRQRALVKHIVCSQLHDLCLWRQPALVTPSCFAVPWLMFVAAARCRHKHQACSCENMDGLPALTVATSINHGVANNHNVLQVLTVATSINHWSAKSRMLYKCSLSHQASIIELRKTGWFTNADCHNKQLDDLQVSGVRVRVWVGV